MSDQKPQPCGAWVTANADPGLHLVVYRAELTIRGRHLRVDTTWSFAGPRMEPVAVSVASAEHAPRPVVGDTIRAIPFGALNREARESAAAYETTPVLQALVQGHAEMARAFGPLLTPAARPGPRRGQQLSDEDLEEVASVYRDAYQKGEGVTDAVRNHFHVSKSAAAKRIMKARAAGLLDDIKRGA